MGPLDRRAAIPPGLVCTMQCCLQMYRSLSRMSRQSRKGRWEHILPSGGGVLNPSNRGPARRLDLDGGFQTTCGGYAVDLCDEVGMEVEGMGDGECENEQGRDFDPHPKKTPRISSDWA